MAKEVEIDKLDRQILSILMQNAKTPYTEIAKKLFVSGGTIHVRMNKLIEMGVVQGYNLSIDYGKLGYDITAFLGVYLDKSSLYSQVSKQLETIPEVVGLHYTTGLYNIFAKIICRDTVHLRQTLHDKIQNIPGIQRTETFISLEESVDRPLNIVDEDEPSQ